MAKTKTNTKNLIKLFNPSTFLSYQLSSDQWFAYRFSDPFSQLHFLVLNKTLKSIFYPSCKLDKCKHYSPTDHLDFIPLTTYSIFVKQHSYHVCHSCFSPNQRFIPENHDIPLLQSCCLLVYNRLDLVPILIYTKACLNKTRNRKYNKKSTCLQQACNIVLPYIVQLVFLVSRHIASNYLMIIRNQIHFSAKIKKISLIDLGALTETHPTYFQRLFKRVLTITPKEFGFNSKLILQYHLIHHNTSCSFKPTIHFSPSTASIRSTAQHTQLSHTTPGVFNNSDDHSSASDVSINVSDTASSGAAHTSTTYASDDGVSHLFTSTKNLSTNKDTIF
ncbi:uncharacterized protein ASCRUDRAFT_70532 [Ascoidea rubescens DSM 1968]|uniref:Uncharacterized protein n=1 Tax=Ascoidea rubescens DSM 1968 TaxID=1344418 RepID=A0A1D2VGA1_9ASCO|nr:hypothetical protein ASCRUDRAFT_70532 [Ascoidea rubescens DSM 1968]ODV60629.1 hypothetical protein ASCRUDRAFT_70532 [Ascoidea rubescens DSM 1968]